METTIMGYIRFRVICAYISCRQQLASLVE